MNTKSTRQVAVFHTRKNLSTGCQAVSLAKLVAVMNAIMPAVIMEMISAEPE